MHIVKTSSYQVSKQGVTFVVHAVYALRWWATSFKNEKIVILIAALDDGDGKWRVGFAANPDPYPNCPWDEIDGIYFQWIFNKSTKLEMFRDLYCIQYDRETKQTKIGPKPEPDHEPDYK